MARVPSAVVAAGGLVGGYGVARWTKKRQLGGAVLAVAGAAAAQQWRARAGGKAAGALTAAYVAGFAGSHPLARRWAPGPPCSVPRAPWRWPRGRSPTGAPEDGGAGQAWWVRTLITRPFGSRTKKRRTPHSSSCGSRTISAPDATTWA